MPRGKNKELKIHFSISEVAEEFGLNESTLRFWEKEFSELRPRTNKNGVRIYTREDKKVVSRIHFLVKEQKMTLEGARERLKVKSSDITWQAEVVCALKEIKAELLSLKTAFDEIDLQSGLPS
ncbi:transcriptional regulator [Bacteroidia bacterium]|nr:transcriptional regulator [Bacteroidia bacterium]